MVERPVNSRESSGIATWHCCELPGDRAVHAGVGRCHVDRDHDGDALAVHLVN